jgi:mono/diheme cytochrome c family protein
MVRAMNRPHAVRATAAQPLTIVAALIALAVVSNGLISGCQKKPESESTPSSGTQPTSGAATDTSNKMASGDLGVQVYTARCVLCHGPNGKGDGPGAASLNPKPRNHTDGAYMNARTNEQLLEVIRGGKGAMPAWGNILSDAEIHAVLRHVRSLAQPPYTGPMP